MEGSCFEDVAPSLNSRTTAAATAARLKLPKLSTSRRSQHQPQPYLLLILLLLTLRLEPPHPPYHSIKHPPEGSTIPIQYSALLCVPSQLESSSHDPRSPQTFFAILISLYISAARIPHGYRRLDNRGPIHHHHHHCIYPTDIQQRT